MAEKNSHNQNPALKPLEGWIGEWEMELSHASFLPDPSDTVKGLISFEWVQAGAFLLMRMGDKPPGSPAAMWLIGRDEATPNYTVLYCDDRGVSRVYEMSFTDRVWKMWREAPGFSQRFKGKFSDDGNTVTASWEKSFDGTKWEHDFNVTYTKRRKHMEKNRTSIIAEPGTQEIVITREFDAPRELVFHAFTDPQLITQWWGPRYLSTEIDKMDMRPGGEWRWLNRDAEGNVYAFHGVYHEVLAPERIIDTFEFEGLPEKGHVCLETITLEALPEGRTRLTNQSVFQSVADRDGMLQSGMEAGVHDTYDRLAELLRKR